MKPYAYILLAEPICRDLIKGRMHTHGNYPFSKQPHQLSLQLAEVSWQSQYCLHQQQHAVHELQPVSK